MRWGTVFKIDHANDGSVSVAFSGNDSNTSVKLRYAFGVSAEFMSNFLLESGIEGRRRCKGKRLSFDTCAYQWYLVNAGAMIVLRQGEEEICNSQKESAPRKISGFTKIIEIIAVDMET